MADKKFDKSSIGSPRYIPNTTKPPAQKGVVKPVPRPGRNRWGRKDNHNG